VPIYFYGLIYPETPDSSPDVPTAGWNTITTDDFEGDSWGSYAAGGIQAYTSQDYACNNVCAIHVNVHNGVASSFAHSEDQDCSSYSMLRVTFEFQMDGFDHMDTLFLELSLDGGQNYYIVDDWAMDVNGITTNRVCYKRSVFMAANDFGDRATFGNQARLQFRTNANALNDRVYVDNIRFKGHAGPSASPSQAPSQEPTPMMDTAAPSAGPSASPSQAPSSKPSLSPSAPTPTLSRSSRRRLAIM
jgi:hypothetical protein